MNVVLFYYCNGRNADQFFDAIKDLFPDSFVTNVVSGSDGEVNGIFDSDRKASRYTCDADLIVIEMSRVLLPQILLDMYRENTFKAFMHFIGLMLQLIKPDSKVIFYGRFSDDQVSKLNALRRRSRNFHYSKRDRDKLVSKIQEVVNR
jgi:hypothetical protein